MATASKFLATRPVSAPRNPLVGAARCRLAGAHQRGTKALRQHAERELRRQMNTLNNGP